MMSAASPAMAPVATEEDVAMAPVAPMDCIVATITGVVPENCILEKAS